MRTEGMKPFDVFDALGDQDLSVSSMRTEGMKQLQVGQFRVMRRLSVSSMRTEGMKLHFGFLLFQK